MESKKCPYCDKIIEGYSEDHINQMMDVHIVRKHKNKVKFEEVKE